MDIHGINMEYMDQYGVIRSIGCSTASARNDLAIIISRLERPGDVNAEQVQTLCCYMKSP